MSVRLRARFRHLTRVVQLREELLAHFDQHCCCERRHGFGARVKQHRNRSLLTKWQCDCRLKQGVRIIFDLAQRFSDRVHCRASFQVEFSFCEPTLSGNFAVFMPMLTWRTGRENHAGEAALVPIGDPRQPADGPESGDNRLFSTMASRKLARQRTAAMSAATAAVRGRADALRSHRKRHKWTRSCPHTSSHLAIEPSTR